MAVEYFSASYLEARSRFVTAAERIAAGRTSHPVVTDDGESLTMDVATVGPPQAPTVVISSGIHGVEGFFGSALQLALLHRLRESAPQRNVRYVLIHAVNPFGFARLRRFNEDNVDLNRNFLSENMPYAGAPAGYAQLDPFLNPTTPLKRFEFFQLKALWRIWRHGLHTLKQAVAGGQYDFAKGLFYGGSRACRSTEIVQQHCDAWLGDSQQVIHIDLHSGLGRFGTYKLLLNEPSASERIAWYGHAFGRDCIETLGQPEGTAYSVTGLFGGWMQQHFSRRHYHFIGAEFGTYNEVRILSAIRDENRGYHHTSTDSALYERARLELLECFCPASTYWREQVIKSGMRIIEQSTHALEQL